MNRMDVEFARPTTFEEMEFPGLTIREHVWLTFAAALSSSDDGLASPAEAIGSWADKLTAEFEKRFGGAIEAWNEQVECYKEAHP